MLTAVLLIFLGFHTYLSCSGQTTKAIVRGVRCVGQYGCLVAACRLSANLTSVTVCTVWYILDHQVREKRRVERAARDGFERGVIGMGTDESAGDTRPGEWEPSYGVRTAPAIEEPGFGRAGGEVEQGALGYVEDEIAAQYHDDVEGDDFDDGTVEEEQELVDGTTQPVRHAEEQEDEPDQFVAWAGPRPRHPEAMTEAAATVGSVVDAMEDGLHHQFYSEPAPANTLDIPIPQQLKEDDYVGVIGTLHIPQRTPALTPLWPSTMT